VDLGELLFLVALFLVVVSAFAISRRGPGLMEVAPKHDTFLKGVLDGTLVVRPSLRLLILPEDGFDRLLARGELGGDVHKLARLGGSLAPQFAHQVSAGGAGEEHPDDIRVGDVGQLGALL
jgi:hypothetical protein